MNEWLTKALDVLICSDKLDQVYSIFTILTHRNNIIIQEMEKSTIILEDWDR